MYIVYSLALKFIFSIQSSYHTLVGIAMELVGALESAVAGNMVRICLALRPN